MKAVHVEWDVDNEEDLQSLPTEIEIPDGMTDEDEISDYLSEMTGFCHRGFSLSTDPSDKSANQKGSGKESRADRFRRVAEARVNKIIKMIRLLGNCSSPGCYAFTDEQIHQIFAVLQAELDQAQKRFTQPGKKHFSLSSTETPEKPKDPTITLPMPDGTVLRAVAYAGDSYPAINVYWDSAQAGDQNLIGFAECNPEKPAGYEVCVGAYRSDQDDTAYYRPYMAERESNEDNETWRYADRL